MALLFVDGFDHVDDVYRELKYEYAENTKYESTISRTGGWGINLDYIGLIRYSFSDVSSIIVGCAYRFQAFKDTADFLELRDGATIQVTLRANTSGGISAYRGTTLLGSSANSLLSLNTWYYLEIKTTIHDSAGVVEVRLDGNSTPIITLTGIDTQVTANAYVNKLQISDNDADIYIDDLYVCDTTGTKNNDFLGDIKITTLYPTSDGNSSDFTRSTGTANYETVDEPQLLGTSDYNESGSINDKDLYGVTTYAGSETVLGVQVCAAVANTQAGSVTVRPVVRSGATPADNEGGDVSVNATVKGAMHIFEQEPEDIVDWTVAKVNAAEFGLKIQA